MHFTCLYTLHSLVRCTAAPKAAAMAMESLGHKLKPLLSQSAWLESVCVSCKSCHSSCPLIISKNKGRQWCLQKGWYAKYHGIPFASPDMIFKQGVRGWSNLTIPRLRMKSVQHDQQWLLQWSLQWSTLEFCSRSVLLFLGRAPWPL